MLHFCRFLDHFYTIFLNINKSKKGKWDVFISQKMPEIEKSGPVVPLPNRHTPHCNLNKKFICARIKCFELVSSEQTFLSRYSIDHPLDDNDREQRTKKSKFQQKSELCGHSSENKSSGELRANM